MNKEHLLHIASLIEANPEQFDMTKPNAPSCDTPGCIGGFCQLFEKKTVTGAATKYFDITYQQAIGLCYPHKGIWEKYEQQLNLPKNWNLFNITPKMAITMLRKLASGEWTF
jgi:hypothetical protein